MNISRCAKFTWATYLIIIYSRDIQVAQVLLALERFNQRYNVCIDRGRKLSGARATQLQAVYLRNIIGFMAMGAEASFRRFYIVQLLLNTGYRIAGICISVDPNRAQEVFMYLSRSAKLNSTPLQRHYCPRENNSAWVWSDKMKLNRTTLHNSGTIRTSRMLRRNKRWLSVELGPG